MRISSKIKVLKKKKKILIREYGKDSVALECKNLLCQISRQPDREIVLTVGCTSAWKLAL